MPRALPLLQKLASFIGPELANLEVKWLKQALPQHPLHSLIRRRLSGEPLQYILGTQPFGPLNLLVRPPVLIPRPETEHWAIRLAHYVRPSIQHPLKLLDLCTGSGCIPLLLCHLWPQGALRAFACDIAPDAVNLALDNAVHCGVPTSSSNVPSNVLSPFQADMLSPSFTHVLKRMGPFQIITSNPPYIPKHQYDLLPPSVKNYEDPRALLGDIPGDSGGQGLSFYHAIARLVSQEGTVNRGGLLVLEVGHGQAKDVERIMRTEGNMSNTEIWLDPWGKSRVILARK